MWNKIPSDSIIEKTAKALKQNGIEGIVVQNKKAAKEKVLELIPKGASVMTMSSVTLDTSGISKEINESGNFDSIKNKLNSMKRETQRREMQMLGAAPEFAVGSVHALTWDGKLLIASNTGSQLPAYVYGADRVIWVIGAQKIVEDFDEGLKRIYEHILPLESERLKKLYGIPSNVSKLLVINKEIRQGRLTAIIVKEPLGF